MQKDYAVKCCTYLFIFKSKLIFFCERQFHERKNCLKNAWGKHKRELYDALLHLKLICVPILLIFVLIKLLEIIGRILIFVSLSLCNIWVIVETSMKVKILNSKIFTDSKISEGVTRQICFNNFFLLKTNKNYNYQKKYVSLDWRIFVPTRDT